MTERAGSDHFDGKRFFNPNGTCAKGFREVFRWLMTRKPAKWPERVSNSLSSRPIPDCAAAETALTFIGHSTFLLQFGPTNILLDPIFSQRASPVSWAGPKRVRPPAIEFDHLPRIDLVLVSHCHYDHLDLRTLHRLQKRNAPTVITLLANGRIIRKAGVRKIAELDWWESIEHEGLRITATPAQHFSARKFSDRNKALWGGFIIEAEGRKVFFAGDSGYAEHFKAVAERFPKIDVALLPIGAYEPRWFMTEYHMNPIDAVHAFLDLKAARAVAMHFGTFQLTDEPIDEPKQHLASELARRDIEPKRFVIPEFGQTLFV